MSSMGLLIAGIDSHYRNIVIHKTWGHLFPNKSEYNGSVRIAKGIYQYSSNAIIDEQNLPDSSPWWFDAITDFALNATEKMENGEITEFCIQVNIVECVEELSAEQIEDEKTPDTWSEIHIKEVKKKIIRKGWNRDQV